MSTPQAYASFLVRLWHEDSTDSDETAVDWRGEVEHIQSGQRWILSTLDETLNCLRGQADDLERSNE